MTLYMRRDTKRVVHALEWFSWQGKRYVSFITETGYTLTVCEHVFKANYVEAA